MMIREWGLEDLYFFFFKEIHVLFYLFIYSWLCWVPASARRPPPAAASGDHSPSRCAGLPPSRPLPLRSTGSRRAGSAIVAHGPSRSAARGILPDQGSNPRPPHRQADSQPLRHQGSPEDLYFKKIVKPFWWHDLFWTDQLGWVIQLGCFRLQEIEYLLKVA